MSEPIILPEAVQHFLKTNFDFVLKTDNVFVARLVTQLTHSLLFVTKQRDDSRIEREAHKLLSQDAQNLRHDFGKTDNERKLENSTELANNVLEELLHDIDQLTKENVDLTKKLEEVNKARELKVDVNTNNKCAELMTLIDTKNRIITALAAENLTLSKELDQIKLLTALSVDKTFRM